MPVPAPNLYPDFNIVRLSHVEYRVTDLARSRAFYVDTLGLQVTYEDNTHIYLRAMEERGHHCISLVKADKADVGVLGFKLYDEPDLDKAADWFAARNLPVEWVEKPYMGRTLRTRDPWGIPLEFYVKMDRLAPIHQQYKLYNGVKPLRIDHFNMFSADVDASVAFYNEMGFRTTEYTEDAETGRVWAAWMHRKGGVHDVAFTNGTRPAPAPHGLLGADPAQHHRPPRPDVDHGLGGQHRTRSGAARHLECLLPLCTGPGRPPDRDLLLRLPDR